MSGSTWTTGISGDWNTAADWTPAGVPNSAGADVTIDAPTTAPYTVTIGTGETETINFLAMNTTNNLLGSIAKPYDAAILLIQGTLAFSPGSAGGLGGSLQSFVGINNGTIINPGTIYAFVQGQGNVLLTGTNGIYITNWLQSLAGDVTVDTKSIAELTGNTLFDGIFEAKGPGGVINLGGPLQNLIVNIATVEGPPAIPGGWTELILNGSDTAIGEWNGTNYVSVETSLNTIGSRGTVDVLGGRAYTTTNMLTIDATGLLNLQAGTVTTGGIDINGGTVQGYGDIANTVTNNGVLMALGGILTVGSNLSGVGLVEFDKDLQTGTISAAGAVVEVHTVGAAQTFLMNGDDTLVMDTPATFAGTISAKVGDTFALGGVTATNAVLSGTTLLVENGSQTVASLALSGSYTGDRFAVTSLPGGTQIQVVNTAPGTPIALKSGTQPYVGPVAGLQYQYIDLTTESLNITATAPNSFIHSGSGTDAIDVSGVNGNNVLDGGTGSSFLVGGTGNDTFFLDARNTSADTFSTVVHFHSGDNATFFGVNATDFTMSVVDNAGAPGYTGVAIGFTAPGHPIANLVLTGFTSADLTNGRLVESFGTTAATPGLPGSPYFNIHAT